MQKTEMDCRMSASLPYFLSGLGAGIALTLLLAPMSGAATRKMIRRNVRNGEKRAKDLTQAAKNYVLTRGADFRDLAKEASEAIGKR
jgi:gas vesicle protein